MVKEKKPALVFLMETKLRKKKLEEIHYKIGYYGLFVVDCIGRSGGLALLWSSEMSMEIQNYSQHYINAVIKAPINDVPWKLTGFYGHPVLTKRHITWNLL
jgi:hypothetical protein